MDYQKTAELYEKAGQKKRWENTPEYLSYLGQKAWYDKVKSKRTSDYYQAQDLINRNLVPSGWEPPHIGKNGQPVTYPLKHVNSIIRRRLSDGSEWLTSRQQWWGLDEAGNPINQTFDDTEIYNDILPTYKLKPENPMERDSKIISEVIGIQHRIRYTLPFTKENAQKLWDMRNGNCTLVLKDESKDSKPYSVDSFEQFLNPDFGDLMEALAIPKWKLDRNYGDRLDDSGVQ
jgi:hypothetical protein